MNYLYLAATLAAGTAGGLTAQKLRIPAGSMIGALIMVSILNISTPLVTYPSDLRVFVQILSGVVIASRFTRDDVAQLRGLIVPAAILVVCLLSFTVIFALAMTRFTAIDLPTAFFSCAPGGVSDLALISADMGANPEQVSLLQLGRFAFVLLFFPFFIKKRYLGKIAANTALTQNTAGTGHMADRPETSPQNRKNLSGPNKPQKTRAKGLSLISLAAGIAGGYLFRFLGIPAGGIIGSISCTIIAGLCIEPVFFPKACKLSVQIFAGCYIGSQITRHAFLSIPQLLAPLAIVVSGILAMAFISAFFIHRATGMEFVTCLFSCTPGGIAEMGLIAEDLGLDTPKIIIMHTVRVIAVVCVFPVLAGIFV